jgi:hypothetical protein
MSLKKGSEFKSSHANAIAAVAFEVREVDGSREGERERGRERSVRSHDDYGDEKRKKKMELLVVLSFVGGWGGWENGSYVD